MRWFRFRCGGVRRRLRRATRRRTCVLALTAFAVAFASLTTWMTYQEYYGCSYAEVQNAVDVICGLYLAGEAVGNLCHDLCVSGDLRPEGCLHHHLGKDVVFAASWNEERVIVKATKLYPSQFEPPFVLDEEGHTAFPDWNELADMVRSSIGVHLNVTLTGHAWVKTNGLRKMWSPNVLDTYLDDPRPRVREAAATAIWHLVQQTEYVLLKYFEDDGIFPEVVGTCGHTYAVRFVEPLPGIVVYWGRHTFPQRAAWALKLLEHLADLKWVFPQPFHYCDVKGGHFGIDEGGRARLLDADMVFVESSLVKTIQAGAQPCTSDEDCSFVDCTGQCDPDTKRCLARITNDNLQRVCKNVFLGSFARHSFGLLASPPSDIREELFDLLQMCIDPSSSPHKSSDAVAASLAQLLRRFASPTMTESLPPS